MCMHDRHYVGTRLHDLEMKVAFVDRLDLAFQPIALEIHEHDIIDVHLIERPAGCVDVSEDQYLVGPGDTRADMSLGQRPHAARGQDAMDFRQAAPELKHLGFEGLLPSKISHSPRRSVHDRSPCAVGSYREWPKN